MDFTLLAKELGIPPGVPTMKGAYGDPENTGVGYNTIITELGDHSVPKNWEQFVVKREPGETPGPPIIWSNPQNPEEVEAGYGFIPDDSNEAEETFFYHSDHLGSTSYITDDKGNITQYTAYLPYGELLVDEHSSSEDLPYKFNGKELDEETGLYYYGARYMQPVASVWYGVDPLMEKYPHASPYVYCANNPIKFIDPDGRKIYVPQKYQPAVLEMINSFSKTQYKIDEKGFMYADGSIAKNEKGSTHYSERLDAIISAEGKLTIMIADKYTATNGRTSKTFDVNKMGGGLTDATVKTNVKTLVSEKGHMVHDSEGNKIKKTSAEVLIHEIVGHAAPAIVGTETGNAVKNENIVRKELNLPERADEENHKE